ncbi:uncharacterized protein LOC106867166 isoform X2 [Octopus bimaculoides]|uniref:uncharacterized protein LOC106867166 isoform X2 n=1 Tax=Octopus bimaculoides TaxID=37653 RepID=UPI00071DA232|nr:uncharacterized protein LOC106867166 isoform X2 [Octopus bimaculoides]|eukprot:XP_014767455.1 PREDICTED: uncharacterized protein LOC106867166 isoform X2 [Octopus bimaculoides]
MDNFFGTWKQEGKAENMKAVMDATTGVSDKEKDLMINMLNNFVISRSGDKYSMVHSCDDPQLTKSYIFDLDEPLESTDIFGRKFKSIFKLANPNLLTETCSEWTDGVIDISYEITSSDTLKCSIQLKGVTSTSIFKKVTS